MLNARRLRVLQAVDAGGSFAAAAAELRYTTAAISQQIATLEREVGFPVVHRHARGVRTTAAGETLLRHAEAIFAALAAAEAEVNKARSGENGRVRVAAFASAWQSLLPRAVASFRASRPEVHLALDEADPADAIPAVAAGELDVAIVFEPNASGSRRAALRYERLAVDELRAVVPREHRLGARRRLRLEELAGEAWVQPTAACADLVLDACARAGFRPQVVFASADYTAVQGFVAAGAGVALVPTLALAARDDLTVCVLDGNAPAREIAAVSARRPLPAAAAFVETLRGASADPAS